MTQKLFRRGLAGLALVALTGCGTLSGSPAGDLADDVRGRRANDPLTGRCLISVSITDGVVTLDGRVPDESVRMRAKGIARGAEGVKGVVDNLVTP